MPPPALTQIYDQNEPKFIGVYSKKKGGHI